MKRLLTCLLALSLLLACIGCGSCEKVCPQQIKIPDMMRDFTDRLREES